MISKIKLKLKLWKNPTEYLSSKIICSCFLGINDNISTYLFTIIHLRNRYLQIRGQKTNNNDKIILIIDII